MIHNRSCVFCESFTGQPRQPWDTVVAETRDYVVAPSKGALVPGWLLVISKQHFLCTGSLQRSAYTGLIEAVGIAQSLVERRFGPATVFEHGPTRSGTPLGCGIDHLHIHVVPLAFSLSAAMTELFGSKWVDVPQIADLRRLHQSGVGYAVVREPGTGWRRCLPPPNTRQPLRRAVAQMIGMPDRFDYRIDHFLPNVLQTVKQLSHME